MRRKSLIFVICYLAYTSIYIARLNLSVASPMFVDLEIADAAQIGILGSVFSVFFACGRLINGYIGDSQPPWRMISAGLVLAGISNLVIGILPPFLSIAVLWAINAYAQSMLWSSVLCTVLAVYKGAKAKKMASYIGTSVTFGNILGIVFNTHIVNIFGVEFAFIIPGAIMLVTAVFVFAAVRKVEPETRCEKRHITIIQLLKDKNILKMIIPVMGHGAIKDNISLWMTVYFVDTFMIDLNSSAWFVMFIPLVGLAGRIVFPSFYKACKSREKVVSLISFALCAVIAIPLCCNLKNAFVAVVCLSLLYALVSVINTSMLAIYPMHYVDTGNVASVSGLMDFATYLGAGISSWFYGMIIKNSGYSIMYISWVIIAVVSVLILIMAEHKKKL